MIRLLIVVNKRHGWKAKLLSLFRIRMQYTVETWITFEQRDGMIKTLTNAISNDIVEWTIHEQ